MKYRAEVDGLRSIAVTSVILFHGGFPYFSGGFIGVDIFFVISGYLITSIISEEISNKKFSITKFYERRARRILPALFVMMAACLPMAWLWMLPAEFASFGKSVVSVILFSSNILFYMQSGYFDTGVDLKPLLHTWSLSVEEQFYVFFPLILLVIWRFSRRSVFMVLGAIALASFTLSEYGWRFHPEANFYLAPSRAWEFLAGSFCALYLREHSNLRNNGLAALGLVLIILPIFIYDKSTPFPSAYTIAPVLGTALVILFGTSGTWAKALLSTRVCVAIGLISYSTYLWHQPLFAFARLRSPHEPSLALMALLAIASYGLGYVSWRWIESPFRTSPARARVPTRPMLIGFAAAACGFLAFGLAGYVFKGLPGRLPQDVVALWQWTYKNNPRAGACMSGDGKFIDPAQACTYDEAKPAKVAIIGDSHASAIANELSRALSPTGTGLKEFTFAGCPPIPGVRPSDRINQCAAYNDDVYRYLLAHDEIESVVVMGRWPLYLEGDRFNNHEGGVEEGAPAFVVPVDSPSFKDEADRKAAVGKLFQAGIRTLMAAGKCVVLVYPLPEVGWHVPNLLAKAKLFGYQLPQPVSTSYDVYKQRSAAADALFDQLGQDGKLVRVKPEKEFCDSVVPGRCVAEINGTPLYFDDNHPNSVAARLLSERIVAQMQAQHCLGAPEDQRQPRPNIQTQNQ